MDRVMKENEAPEKIYLIRNFPRPTSLNTTNDYHGKYLQEWYKSREKDADVEYNRTDTFIEKAWDWIYDNLLSANQQDKSRLYFEQFVNYMKGE